MNLYTDENSGQGVTLQALFARLPQNPNASDFRRAKEGLVPVSRRVRITLGAYGTEKSARLDTVDTLLDESLIPRPDRRVLFPTPSISVAPLEYGDKALEGGVIPDPGAAHHGWRVKNYNPPFRNQHIPLALTKFLETVVANAGDMGAEVGDLVHEIQKTSLNNALTNGTLQGMIRRIRSCHAVRDTILARKHTGSKKAWKPFQLGGWPARDEFPLVLMHAEKIFPMGYVEDPIKGHNIAEYLMSHDTSPPLRINLKADAGLLLQQSGEPIKRGECVPQDLGFAERLLDVLDGMTGEEAIDYVKRNQWLITCKAKPKFEISGLETVMGKTRPKKTRVIFVFSSAVTTPAQMIFFQAGKLHEQPGRDNESKSLYGFNPFQGGMDNFIKVCMFDAGIIKYQEERRRKKKGYALFGYSDNLYLATPYRDGPESGITFHSIDGEKMEVQITFKKFRLAAEYYARKHGNLTQGWRNYMTILLPMMATKSCAVLGKTEFETLMMGSGVPGTFSANQFGMLIAVDYELENKYLGDVSKFWQNAIKWEGNARPSGMEQYTPGPDDGPDPPVPVNYRRNPLDEFLETKRLGAMSMQIPDPPKMAAQKSTNPFDDSDEDGEEPQDEAPPQPPPPDQDEEEDYFSPEEEGDEETPAPRYKPRHGRWVPYVPPKDGKWEFSKEFEDLQTRIGAKMTIESVVRVPKNHVSTPWTIYKTDLLGFDALCLGFLGVQRYVPVLARDRLMKSYTFGHRPDKEGSEDETVSFSALHRYLVLTTLYLIGGWAHQDLGPLMRMEAHQKLASISNAGLTIDRESLVQILADQADLSEEVIRSMAPIVERMRLPNMLSALDTFGLTDLEMEKANSALIRMKLVTIDDEPYGDVVAHEGGLIMTLEDFIRDTKANRQAQQGRTRKVNLRAPLDEDTLKAKVDMKRTYMDAATGKGLPQKIIVPKKRRDIPEFLANVKFDAIKEYLDDEGTDSRLGMAGALPAARPSQSVPFTYNYSASVWAHKASQRIPFVKVEEVLKVIHDQTYVFIDPAGTTLKVEEDKSVTRILGPAIHGKPARAPRKPIAIKGMPRTDHLERVRTNTVKYGYGKEAQRDQARARVKDAKIRAGRDAKAGMG